MLKLKGTTFLHLDSQLRVFISFFALFRPQETRTRAARNNVYINYADNDDNMIEEEEEAIQKQE